MAGGEKVDLYKLHKEDYVTPKKPTFVNIKKAHFFSWRTSLLEFISSSQKAG